MTDLAEKVSGGEDTTAVNNGLHRTGTFCDGHHDRRPRPSSATVANEFAEIFRVRAPAGKRWRSPRRRAGRQRLTWGAVSVSVTLALVPPASRTQGRQPETRAGSPGLQPDRH